MRLHLWGTLVIGIVAAGCGSVADAGFCAGANAGAVVPTQTAGDCAIAECDGDGLERFVEGLGTIAGVSTLLGLLGTISGMIKMFAVVSTQTVVNPITLAGGISEALVTTYAGLTVAIPALVMYKYLQSKTNALILEMEDHSIRLVELLKEKEGND